MNNSNKNTREMKDSGVEWIGAIPQEWEIRRLGNFSTMIVPMRDKPTSFAGDIPWIRIEDFEGKYISKSKTNQNVTLELIKAMNMKIYPIGTVLCSCSCNLGVSAIVEKELCSNQTFIGVVPNQQIDSVFLYYLMMSNAKRLNYLAEGSIQAYMSRKKFEQLKVQVPPLSEQQVIANYLDKKVGLIDNLITEQKEAIENWKQYKQSLITETVTKGLNPDVEMKDSGVEWIGAIPKEWGVVKVKNLFHLVTGATPKSDTKENWSNEVTWITPVDFKSKFLSESLRKISWIGYNSCGTKLVPKNSIILTCRAPIGGVSLAAVELCFNQGCKALISKKDKVNENYYYYYFLSNQVALNSLGRGTTFLELSSVALNEFPIPYPFLNIQESIAEFLDEKCTKIDGSIVQKEALIKQLEDYKQSLIYECVTGKKQVM